MDSCDSVGRSINFGGITVIECAGIHDRRNSKQTQQPSVGHY